MVGITTTREPIRGTLAKEIHEHLQRVAVARQAGTLKRAQSPHKTNIQLVEIKHA